MQKVENIEFEYNLAKSSIKILKNGFIMLIGGEKKEKLVK
jgi:hypothetical protein